MIELVLEVVLWKNDSLKAAYFSSFEHVTSVRGEEVGLTVRVEHGEIKK